jgi:hypothetical protein
MPTQAGTFSFTIQVRDSSARKANASYSVSIAPPPLQITTSSLPNGQVSSSYSATLAASGGTTPYSWSVTSGALPPGLTLTAATGQIGGTPTQSGTFAFTAQVLAASGQTASASYSINIAPPPLQITTSSLPGGQVSVSYSATLTASGGTAPDSWSVTSGSLPPGLTLTASTGQITGTPSQSGTFSFTAQVQDSSSPVQSKSATYSVSVGSAPLQNTTASLPGGQASSPYSGTLTAGGGATPYSWSLTSGSLPPGLSLTASTGQIGGTPSASGTFSFTTQVQDSSSPAQTASATLSISIAPLPSLDQYGGRTDITCTATGYFHTQKISARWWLCDPLGNAFFKVGLNLVQPSGYYDVITRYGSTANWANLAVPRIQGWGFNTIDTNHSDYIEATNSSAPATKLPFVPTFQPEGYAMTNYAIYDMPGYYSRGLLNYVVKSLFNAMPASFYNSGVYNTKMPDLYDDGIYTLAELFMAHRRTWQYYASSAYQPYIVGITMGEIDNLFALEAGDLNGANPNPSEHLSWVVLAGAPVQTAGAPYDKTKTAEANYGVPMQFLHTDTETKSKTALKNFLQARYATNPPACALSGHTGIQALDDCWGSTYTTFDSTGTQVTGETVATGDGRLTAYNYTLAHLTPARFSLQVFVNGTMVAGELHHDNGNSTASPGNTTSGRIWGPYVTGTVTYATGTISPTFKTTTGIPRDFAQVTTDGSTVTVHTLRQHGLWLGASVTISGTPNGNYDGTYTVASVADSYHFTFAKSGSYATTATGTYALAAAPGASDTISVSYVYNGWEIGTGLMDEANNHSWSNEDATTRKISLLPSTQMQTDLNDFLYQISYYYFSACRAKSNAAFPNLMFLGPGALGSHGWPSRAPILQAAGAAGLPIAAIAYGLPPSQTAIDYIFANFGDRPMMGSFFATANADSPWAGYPEAEVSYPSQAAKGQGYYNIVTTLLNANTNGVYPFAGLTTWGYYDSENKNWGVTTQKDNAYDGHEAVSITVSCSPPLGALSCGGEAANYGDVMRCGGTANCGMVAGNALWLTIR